MSTAPAALFAHLVDDAALFPPGNAPMGTAVSRHREHESGPIAPFLGPFLCPASRFAELTAHLRPDDRLPLGLIVDTGVDGAASAVTAALAEARVELRMVEIPLPADTAQAPAAAAVVTTLAAVPRDVRVFVELPRVEGWDRALEVLAAAGRRAKLRTGGVTAAAFPSEQEVATFVTSCVAAGVSFKCTAGLHNAVRHTAADTGFEHHGFLNILLATCHAVDGRSIDHVSTALAERDSATVAARIRSVDEPTAYRARQFFHSYGSCSVTEPVEDLAALGLIATVAA